MATVERNRAPAHLWVVGIVSLLWNLFGSYDYVMSHTGGREYFLTMGLDEDAFAWFEALPTWSVAAWAIGVWGSVLGSILLLTRSRHAATAFLVSLIGAAISFAYQFSSDRPESMQGGLSVLMPVVILIAIVVQWYYARRMVALGVLR
jgi:hypothetical protein